LSLTLELNCVGVEVCQLRRPAAAAEALKPPSKYDLMESGSLEQDAHAIIMVFYKGQELPDDQSLRNEIELDVEKNRGSGLMGNIPLYFEGDKCRILDDVPFVPNVAPQDIDKEEKTEETQEQQTIKYG
jgi:replicative DNA helicase